MVIDHLLSAKCELGEGPVWLAVEQSLYFVDIDNHRLHRYHPANGHHDIFEIGLPVGIAVPRARGGLLMGTRDGFAFWDVETRRLQFIADPEADVPDSRFNDGAVDHQGRFWAGTLNQRRDPTSSLYRLDPDLSVHVMETGLITPNGTDWSPDGRIMYFTDSRRRSIYCYDFDPASGNIANRRVLIQIPEDDGVPDGLTVDAEGHIWSARWGGWKVVRYTPEGTIDREFRLPVQCPSSCTFGGPHLDELYITSARAPLTPQQRREQPLSGDLFRIKVGVRGQPQNAFAG